MLTLAPLTLVAESPTGALCGAMALFFHPALSTLLPESPSAADSSAWLAALAAERRWKPPQTLVTPFYLLDPDTEGPALEALLATALEICPQLQQVVLAAEDAIPLNQPFLLQHFLEVGAPAPGRAVYEAARNRISPRLTIRRALVEDTDDLLPVIVAASLRYGALATVPASDDSACPLADMLASQDASSIIHVAGVAPCASDGVQGPVCRVHSAERGGQSSDAVSQHTAG